MVEIKPLDAAGRQAVEALLDAAFGADRRARTAYRLREGCDAIAGLSLSAWRAGTLLGTLQSWPVALDHGSGRTPLVMVGPVAVAPEAQGQGAGRALMDAMIAAADTHASATGPARALMMVGDPGYYERFWGFSAQATGGWRLPGPVERHRLLARGVPGAAPPAIAGDLVPDPR